MADEDEMLRGAQDDKTLPVMLSAAKHLAAHRARPFAEFTLERSEGLRVTTHCRS